MIGAILLASMGTLTVVESKGDNTANYTFSLHASGIAIAGASEMRANAVLVERNNK